MTTPTQASFANRNLLQMGPVRRERSSGTCYLLENLDCLAKHGLISFKGLSLVLCEAPRTCVVSLRDKLLQCNHCQARETACPMSFSSRAENQDTKKGKRSCKRRSFMSKGALKSWKSQEQKGRKDGRRASSDEKKMYEQGCWPRCSQ